ncbi:MAG: substrate-binding domain-containing protein [Promethearchaeota archaeon]
MNGRRTLKTIISEHKLAFLVIFILIIGGFFGTFFVFDLLSARNPNRIKLATTTSTYDSGLLDYLLPKFTQKTGIEVSVLSVGTGQALVYGESGDVDVILVHLNDSNGQTPYGINRACVMYNDFLIVGHENNPAELLSNDNITIIMTKLKAGIDSGNSTFYSRGDGSGTYSKELSLWSLINVIPDVNWFGQPDKYTETGQGMATTLQMTFQDANQGYTLIDRGTWLSFNDTYTTLKILAESVVGEDNLLNPYGVIPVNPDLHSHVKYSNVLRFVGFLTSDYGQNLINSYTKNGEKLFHAAFGICNTTHNCPTTEEEIFFWTSYQQEFT